MKGSDNSFLSGWAQAIFFSTDNSK